MVAKSKTMRFEPEVLAAFQNMTWNADGTQAVFNEDLGRLWAKVKKAFEAMGGHWDKKARAILFPNDPRSQIEGLVQTGTLQVARDGFFRTPEPVLDKVFSLLNAEKMAGNWIEPECGDGAAVGYILRRGYAVPENIFAIELNPERAAKVKTDYPGVRVACGDFMAYRHSTGIKIRYGFANPPFEDGQDGEHIRKAYNHLVVGGKMAAIAGEGIFFRDDRKAETFRAWLKAVGAYVEKLPGKSFHASGTDVATRFMIIEKG